MRVAAPRQVYFAGVAGAARRAGCPASRGGGEREGRREGGRKRKEKGKRKKKRGGKKKKMKRENGTVNVDSAAVTAAGRARAPVGRGARDEEEQGDGTVVGYWDQVFGISGDRAGNDFEWIELNN